MEWAHAARAWLAPLAIMGTIVVLAPLLARVRRRLDVAADSGEVPRRQCRHGVHREDSCGNRDGEQAG